MMTPEGKVKQRINGMLRAMGPDLYFFMPVQSGMGSPCLDYLGAHRGKPFAIEAKAPGKKPTPRQKLIMANMTQAGIAVFVVDGSTASYNALYAWLHGINVSPEVVQAAVRAMDEAIVPQQGRYIVPPPKP